MKKEIENLAKKAVSDIASKPISRKEAIKKTGYMAVSAATMMLLLNNPAQAGPQTSNHGNNGWGNGDQNAPGNSGGNNNAENSSGNRKSNSKGNGPWD